MIIKKNAGKKAEDILEEKPVEKQPEVKVEEDKIDLFNLLRNTIFWYSLTDNLQSIPL